MASTSSVDVKVIYDASSRGRGRRRPSPVSAANAARWWWVIGLLNMLVATAGYYAIWWKVDPFIYLTLMTRTPIEGASADALFPVLTGGPADDQGTLGADDDTDVDEEELVLPRFTGRTAMVVMGASAYGWLALATISACLLALSGGAVLGQGGGRKARILGLVLTLAVAAGLILWGWKVWSAYGTHYPPRDFRIWMGGVVLLTAAVGLMGGGRGRWWAKAAGGMMVLGAIGTVSAIVLGVQSGALEPSYADPVLLGTVFAGVSLWGWCLLIMSSHIRG